MAKAGETDPVIMTPCTAESVVSPAQPGKSDKFLIIERRYGPKLYNVFGEALANYGPKLSKDQDLNTRYMDWFRGRKWRSGQRMPRRAGGCS